MRTLVQKMLRWQQKSLLQSAMPTCCASLAVLTLAEQTKIAMPNRCEAAWAAAWRICPNADWASELLALTRAHPRLEEPSPELRRRLLQSQQLRGHMQPQPSPAASHGDAHI
jgi:hypothetical protein